MTTPERGLFERIEQSISVEYEEGQMPHCDRRAEIEVNWQEIKAACALYEQRLAEAEANAKDTREKEQRAIREYIELTAEANQLRARCGELEKQIAEKDRYLKDISNALDCGDVIYFMASKALALTTPQPAQEQSKCKNCGGKGWTWLAGAPAHETNKYPCEFCNLQEQTTK